MKTKLLGMLLLGAAVAVSAQDNKSLLETLVKKGTITEQEAAQIAKESVVVTPGVKDTKKLSIKGGVTVGYDFSSFEIQNGGAKFNENGFDVRYAKIGFEAEIQGGWRVDFITDFGVEGRDRNYLDKVVISKEVKVDYLTGRLDIGLRKVNMGVEQGYDDFELFTPERSLATYFFTRPDMGTSAVIPGVPPAPSTYAGGTKNFGSRAIGLFWEGTIEQVEGLYYGISAVGGNSYEGSSADLSNVDGNGDNLSFYLNFGYKGEQAIKNESFTYDVGLNLGYANGGYVSANPNSANNEIIGVNPYASIKWRGLNVMLEYFMQSVEHGDINGADRATPMGFNAIVAYKFDLGEFGRLEPVFRASIISTDGMGFDPISMYNGVPTTTSALYDAGQTYYIGANWYVIPSVKFSLGYEWGEYRKADRITPGSGTPRMESNALRAQLQVLF